MTIVVDFIKKHFFHLEKNQQYSIYSFLIARPRVND
jgi:hypothetical protein